MDALDRKVSVKRKLPQIGRECNEIYERAYERSHLGTVNLCATGGLVSGEHDARFE